MFEGDFQTCGMLDNVFIFLMAILLMLEFPSALWIYESNNFIFPLLSFGVPQVTGQSLEHIPIYFTDKKV